MSTETETNSIGLEQAWSVVRRRGWIVLACVFLAAAAAFIVSRHETKKYTSAAALSFSYDSLSQQIAGLPVTSGSSLLAQQTSDLEAVRLGDMAAKTAAAIGHGLTAEQVAASLKITSQGESNVVLVTATADSPELAAMIANTYVKQFVGEQQVANHHYFSSALALVRKQLAALSPKQRAGGAGVALEDRAQTLSLLTELNYGNVEVAQQASPPTSASSPKTSKNTALGAFLGLLVGLAAMLLLERRDSRIRRWEDLEPIFQRPQLGAVPRDSALSVPGTSPALPPTVAEAFNLIRAHLRFFTVDRDLRTVMIASAAPGEGKSTIAYHLAAAAARLDSRVLLLELDLRKPTLTKMLGLADGPGVTDVLLATATLRGATQSIVLGGGQAGGTAKLDVLTAGSTLPPNPAELLDSAALTAILQTVRGEYDLVVIDTPPLTAVSDGLPLLRKVDGVVIVARIGLSRRDAAEQLQHFLADSNAPVLGLIANGTALPGVDVYPPAPDAPPQPATSPNGAAPHKPITIKA